VKVAKATSDALSHQEEAVNDFDGGSAFVPYVPPKPVLIAATGLQGWLAYAGVSQVDENVSSMRVYEGRRIQVNLLLSGGRYLKAGQELPDGFELPEHLRHLVADEESDQAVNSHFDPKHAAADESNQDPNSNLDQVVKRQLGPKRAPGNPSDGGGGARARIYDALLLRCAARYPIQSTAASARSSSRKEHRTK
jgi:hypothetical protein